MKRLVFILLSLFSAVGCVGQQLVKRHIVYFGFDEYALDADSKFAIDSLIKTSEFHEINLEAHCDSFGSNYYNDALSLKRAMEVKTYLRSGKINNTPITINALGKRHPLTDNVNEASRQLNRCVILSYEVSPAIPVTEPSPTKPTSLSTINEAPVGSTIKLENINFQGGKHILLPGSAQTLQLLLQTLKNAPGLEIEIRGYICCETGGRDGYDFDTRTNDLSVNRAKAIYEYLIQNGIDAARLSYKGFGSHDKLVEELTEQDRTTNRRVEVRVVKR